MPSACKPSRPAENSSTGSSLHNAKRNTNPATSPLRRRSEGVKATPVGIYTRADLLLLGLVPDGRVVDLARSLDPLQYFGSVATSRSSHSEAHSTLKPWDASCSSARQGELSCLHEH
jgi:hypothetical protein